MLQEQQGLLLQTIFSQKDITGRYSSECTRQLVCHEAIGILIFTLLI
jgi:hypothetical protein